MLLVAGALGAAPGGAGRDAGQARADPSGPSTLWTASLAIGHDSDLLADPDGRGVLEPVGTSFRTAATRLRATWFGSGPREDRLTLTGQAALGDHGAGLPGLDSDLGLVGGYSRWLRDAALLDVGLELDRFRRETLPLFDLDRLRAELGLTYVTGTRWWMGPVVSTTWTGYPGRALEDGDTQRDRRLDLGVRLNRTDRGVSQLALEALHRRNRSSDRLVEYDGWLGLAELRLTPAERLTVRATLAVDRRAYRDYPVLAADGTTVLGQRRDRTWRAALDLELATGSWVTPFAGGIYVHQTSTIDAFAFDELRLEVGIELRLLPRRSLTSGPAARPAAGRRPAAGETLTALLDAALARAGATAGDAAPTDIRRPLAPVLTERGVSFRVRSPAATRVAVVGGFNDWDPARSPLHDPDGDGLWEAVIPVPAGLWRYAVVIDGSWQAPPDAARYEEDGFGGTLGLLEVPGAAGAGRREGSP